ncbi:7275_t:CDS:2, partial [Paraglomus brasilianum]
MFISGGLPMYSILQSTSEQQMPTYIGNSIQQPNGAPFPQQNLFTNEVIMPMHRLSRQNSVQDMLGVFPIEPSDYAQSQVYPTEIIPRPPPSQASIQQQSNVDQSGNEDSHQSSQMETDEQPSQSQHLHLPSR